MKEMLIAFFLVLVVSSIMNGRPRDDEQRLPVGGGTPTVNAADNPLIGSATEKTFKEQVLQSPMPVLVEFYVENDPHCVSMDPIISDFATTYQAQLKVVKVDAMNNPLLMTKYEIGVMPGFILFNKGSHSQALAGEMTRDELGEFIGKNLPQAQQQGG